MADSNEEKKKGTVPQGVPCPGCNATMPKGANICANCGYGKKEYELEAERSEGKDGWAVLVMLSYKEPPAPGHCLSCQIRVMEDGADHRTESVPTEGLVLPFAFKDKERQVRFQVFGVVDPRSSTSGPFTPKVKTSPLVLPVKKIKKKPTPLDPTKGFWGNFWDSATNK